MHYQDSTPRRLYQASWGSLVPSRLFYEIDRMKMEEPTSVKEPKAWDISFHSHGVFVFILVLSSSLHYVGHFLAEVLVVMHLL